MKLPPRPHASLLGLVCLLVQFALSACQQQTMPDHVMSDQATLDGQSQQAFYHSMAALKTQIPAAEFERLVWAVGILQVYDLAPLSLDDFYASLNGVTVTAIIDRAVLIQQQQP